MIAGITWVPLPPVSIRELERIRRACIEEGLLEEDELLDLEDLRYLRL